MLNALSGQLFVFSGSADCSAGSGSGSGRRSSAGWTAGSGSCSDSGYSCCDPPECYRAAMPRG